jgi:hypothetical protein
MSTLADRGVSARDVDENGERDACVRPGAATLAEEDSLGGVD